MAIVMSLSLKLARTRHNVGIRCREAAKNWQAQLQRLFNRYRPEFHYMRGPGPKWREKHDPGNAGAKR